MYEIISSIIKYFFITIIYLFIFSIIRLIYLDIRQTNIHASIVSKKSPYLKLLNNKEQLSFFVEDIFLLNTSKSLGKNTKNDISIQDPFLSNNHSFFSYENGYFNIMDAGSATGTYVNKNKIVCSSMRLKNGDSIQVGQLNFVFVDNQTLNNGGG